MKYATRVIPAVFLERPNRFIARVLLDGREETVHVKNTGRCRELLVPGCRVWLCEGENPARKTRWDLIAVEKKREGKPALLINMDSGFPNDAAEEWLKKSGLFGPSAIIRREVTWGNSRFDFCIAEGNRTTLLEVKGCTLERDGIVSFPDAPTQRGTKHLRELTAAVRKGLDAGILILVQMKEARLFCPNDDTDPEFGKAVWEAVEAGVKLLVYDCVVTPESMTVDAPVPVQL